MKLPTFCALYSTGVVWAFPDGAYTVLGGGSEVVVHGVAVYGI